MLANRMICRVAVTGPPVPEIVEIESRRLHRGGIAGLHPSQALEDRDRVDGPCGADIRHQWPGGVSGQLDEGRTAASPSGCGDVSERAEHDAHRGCDSVDVALDIACITPGQG